MVDKIDEILRNEKWKKKKIISKEPAVEEKSVRIEEHVYSASSSPADMEKMIRIRSLLPSRKGPLGGTGPKPWFDKYYHGGNAYPRNRRREHPSGHHNCG